MSPVVFMSHVRKAHAPLRVLASGAIPRSLRYSRTIRVWLPATLPKVSRSLLLRLYHRYFEYPPYVETPTRAIKAIDFEGAGDGCICPDDLPLWFAGGFDTNKYSALVFHSLSPSSLEAIDVSRPERDSWLWRVPE